MGNDQKSQAWAVPAILRGQHVNLEPLRFDHAADLRAAAADGELWRCWYTNVPMPGAVEKYVASALKMQETGDALVFSVRDAAGDLVGTTRYYDLDVAVPRLSIGYTWYAQRAQRTGLNTEAKLLLLAHAFETLGCIAVALETSLFNHASRTAITRLGAKQDGVLRNHKRHADGSVRDTVVFSIIDSEWPVVKRNLLARLAEHG
jgi:RimJ/RimL family protein N-acetyltransferase